MKHSAALAWPFHGVESVEKISYQKSCIDHYKPREGQAGNSDHSEAQHKLREALES
jgi:hypothetical protein